MHETHTTLKNEYWDVNPGGLGIIIPFPNNENVLINFFFKNAPYVIEKYKLKKTKQNKNP